MVAVREAGERYRCNICGNEVEVTKAGGGELVCCGQPMELTEEAVQEDTGPEEEIPTEVPEEEPSEEQEPGSEEERPTTF